MHKSHLNIYLGRQALSHIDHERTSLLPNVLDTLKTMINDPICMAMIEKQNAHYLAIENREFDKLVLKSSDNLAELSEGEVLLKKLVEPYKGKFVLLDIWGTWCGPCKEALSHSTEEYARLKDYDIEFLYLANESPQTAWENVIKEYNVSGPNVAHYNLPREQQKAIERHLGVHSWPTYKLFNRDGDLLDLNVSAFDLDNFPYKIRGIPSVAVSMLTLHRRIISLNYTKNRILLCYFGVVIWKKREKCLSLHRLKIKI